MSSPINLAEVVISTAGRDQGRHYLVIGHEDERYVMVADGDVRKLGDPKRKNVKHLMPTGYVDKELAIWLSQGKRVRNEDVKKAMKEYENKEEAI